MRSFLRDAVILALAAFSASSAGASQSPPAPFGLTWGISAEEAGRLGTLESMNSDDCGRQAMISDLPRVLVDTEFVIACFGYNDQLWRITAVSKTFSNDPYGSSILARYNELVELLEDKYGAKDEHHFRDDLWTDADEFLIGIHTGRSWHYTNFDTTEVNVQIGIRAKSMSDGYYVLNFEHEGLAGAHEEGRKHEERDAL